MKFNPEIGNSIWEFIVGILAAVFLRNNFILKWIFRKLSDALAKPLYDLMIRKGIMKVEEVKAKKAEEKLETAQTKTEINQAIDEIP